MFDTTKARTEIEYLAAKRRAVDAAEAEWLELVAKYDQSCQYAADGYLTAGAAIAHACTLPTGVATGHVTLARKLQKLPETRDAFGAGDISRAHAAVIAQAHTAERAPMLSPLETKFVAFAKTYDAQKLREMVQHYTDALDGDDGANRDKNTYDRRRLHISPLLDGIVRTDALHDPLSGEIWMTAIDAEMERDRYPDDTRTPAQRRHDAATNIMRRALETGDLGTSRGVRPHVSLVHDVNDLATNEPQLVAEAHGQVEHVGRLSKTTIGLLLCDCTISRVLINGPSQVLDVGRATRTISAPLWKALIARDRHCTHPRCDKKPAWCQAHHIIAWEHGGPTDLDNLKLLCWHHHRHAHHTRAGP